MQLLIVDDEHLIIDELQSALDWESIGITSLYTANNIRQAKEAFAAYAIDIMLCDIEMPQGSGLELLSWVRSHYPRTESIFLTCHADFRYAKEALRLGSLDYLLKPVPYAELERTVASAIEKIRSESRLEEYSKYGEFWFKHQSVVVERLWADILNRTIPSNPALIRDAFETRNIPYVDKMTFLPIMLHVRRWHEDWSLRDLKIMEYAIKNIVAEVILKEGANGQIIELDKGRFVVILSLWNQPAISIDQLKAECLACVQACHEHLQCDLTANIGETAQAHELPVLVDRLWEQQQNKVASENTVFLLSEHEPVTKAPERPDMDTWSIMLSEGLREPLLKEISNYLEHAARRNSLDAIRLTGLQHDFIQMVYSTLKQRGIQAHELLHDAESQRLYKRSTDSVREFLTWIRHVVSKAVTCSEELDKSQSIVNKAKTYIELHLEQELTREEIGSHCYLNADYLDRIFKKETGSSVTKYIVQERLTKAKELLSKTELPISAIAMMIGYKNLSHFSAAFKKFTAYNPVDFRREAANGRTAKQEGGRTT
jgi:two-component system response regulator YesN